MSGYNGIFGPKLDRKAACPECQKETHVETLFEKFDRWETGGGEIQGVVQHYVFQCRGCKETFFAKASGNSEDYFDIYDTETGEETQEYFFTKTYWPTVPIIQIPSWIETDLDKFDSTLSELMADIYSAMNANLLTFAAIGIRTAFDRVSELLGINTEFTFAQKLEELRKSGHIGGAQKGDLEVLIDAGSAAAHRGWKPTAEQLFTMLDALETLIKGFLLKSRLRKLKSAIPIRTRQ